MTVKPSGPREFEPEWLQRSLDRHLTWGLVFMAVLIVAFPIYRSREDSLRRDATREQQTNYIAAGTDEFKQNCSTCHGPQATGGSTAPTLNSKQFLSSVTDDQMRLIVSTGVPGSSMTAWDQEFGGPLPSQQIREVFVYLSTP